MGAIGTQRWKVSLHGGHSGTYCEHATGTLREVLDAAVSAGFSTYGVSEHAPRYDDRHVFDTERQKGYDLSRLKADFEAYAAALPALVEEYAPRIEILRGFEIESVPLDRYTTLMTDLRRRHAFDYVVGSVHFIRDIPIDGPPALFEMAVEHCGGLEALTVEYYGNVTEMIRAMRPEIVAHLDLVMKNAPKSETLDSPRIAAAAEQALEAAREHACILDLNTAGYRKGLMHPYPAPWLVQRARAMGVPFCFGDDSHGPGQVGLDIERGRDYLLTHGVSTITALTRVANGGVRKVRIPLQ